jgi:hypothetical protein
LTRSHHIYRLRFTSKPTRPHEELPQRKNHGVTYVNVYRRSLSSSLNPSKSQPLQNRSLVKANSSRDRDSQGLRRPRFSFFILTCQTAQGSQPHFHQRKVSQDPTRRRITTDGYRLFIHSSSCGASQARKPARPKGLGGAALSGRFISPPLERCQRLMSTNRRIWRKNHSAQEVPTFSSLAPYKSHNPATI